MYINIFRLIVPIECTCYPCVRYKCNVPFYVTVTRGIIPRMMGNPRGRWRERHDWNDISVARDGARSSHASRSSPAPPVAGDLTTMRSLSIEIFSRSRRHENVARSSTNDDDDDDGGQADDDPSTVVPRSSPVLWF